MLNQGKHILLVLIYIGTFLLFSTYLKAQSAFDSLYIKPAKHYFKTVVFLDTYGKPNQTIEKGKGNDTIFDKKLETYGIKQSNFGFYTPIYTRTELNADSTVYSNTHYLLTGNFLTLKPKFDGIKEHTLIKYSLGMRIIRNSGKKGVWFIDISPFITKDITTSTKNGYLRMANSFIYSHNYSERFNMRLGITKSFLWGNRNYLPYIGFRFGKLNKANFSIQIPKNISFNLPINNKFRFSIFSKPQGGMFAFLNNDSIYYEHPERKWFNFTRYEILSGLRFDVVLSKNFACYAALGTSTKNNITFYSNERNAERPRLPYKIYFYQKDMKTTGFLNLGFVWRFGKTKSFYNDKNMYDVFDLNHVNGIGDENSGPGNTDIPIQKTIKRSNLNLADIQDLIDVNDN